MPDGASFYTGQWNATTNQRHGQVKAEWVDGSKYEGYWFDDQPDGRGRLIHSDGDVYIGDWKAGKAHGFGDYTHTDGAHYCGEWLNDMQQG